MLMKNKSVLFKLPMTTKIARAKNEKNFWNNLILIVRVLDDSTGKQFTYPTIFPSSLTTRRESSLRSFAFKKLRGNRG